MTFSVEDKHAIKIFGAYETIIMALNC